MLLRDPAGSWWQIWRHTAKRVLLKLQTLHTSLNQLRDITSSLGKFQWLPIIHRINFPFLKLNTWYFTVFTGQINFFTVLLHTVGNSGLFNFCHFHCPWQTQLPSSSAFIYFALGMSSMDSCWGAGWVGKGRRDRGGSAWFRTETPPLELRKWHCGGNGELQFREEVGLQSGFGAVSDYQGASWQKPCFERKNGYTTFLVISFILSFPSRMLGP